MASERLTALALLVLDETIDAAKKGRLPPSAGLRLALAYLYEIGDRRGEYFDREPYDEFWRRATKEDATLLNAHNVPGYCRIAAMRVSFNGIERAAKRAG